MSIKVKILPYLRYHTDDKTMVEVEGSTIAQCLDSLTKQFPRLSTVLFDGNGKLLNYVDIYVNGRSSYYEGLARPVKEGDELCIILIIGGG